MKETITLLSDWCAGLVSAKKLIKIAFPAEINPDWLKAKTVGLLDVSVKHWKNHIMLFLTKRYVTIYINQSAN